MKVECPKCGRAFAREALNVKKDLAYCEQCSEAFAFSQLVADRNTMAVDLSRPPPGAWFTRTATGFQVGGSTRSAVAFFLVPFMCVWSGGSLGGIYGSQIISGRFDLGASLFGIPFLLGSLLFWSLALMAVGGKVALAVAGDEATLFTGVGPFGWRRRFRWSDVRRVEEIGSSSRYPGSTPNQLALLGNNTRFTMGQGLNETRKAFVMAAVARMLAERRGSTRLEPGSLALAEDGVSSGELSLSDGADGGLSMGDDPHDSDD